MIEFLPWIFIGILTVWVILLTILYFKSVSHYKKLKIKNGESLEKVINTVFKGLEQLHDSLTAVEGRVSAIETKNKKHIQKVSIKRFNPFGDTGGDQSFSAAFLDANNDGVVFSSLHGRSGTRVYAKPIVSGKQDKYEFSEEEQDVINLAVKEK